MKGGWNPAHRNEVGCGHKKGGKRVEENSEWVIILSCGPENPVSVLVSAMGL